MASPHDWLEALEPGHEVLVFSEFSEYPDVPASATVEAVSKQTVTVNGKKYARGGVGRPGALKGIDYGQDDNRIAEATEDAKAEAAEGRKRWEIVRSCSTLSKAVQSGEYPAEKLDELATVLREAAASRSSRP